MLHSGAHYEGGDVPRIESDGRIERVRSCRRADRESRPAVQNIVWTAVLVGLLAGVAVYFGAFDWYTNHWAVAPDGTRLSLPNTFASIDHPFHIAKERATLDALRNGWLPRWFSNHQAGFPTEFYPAGGDVIVALVYALGLGKIPLEISHKLVVIGVLLLPAVVYWVITRLDRLPVSIAVIAALFHLFLPGNWLGGGPEELIYMGMWPNVLAVYLPLVLLVAGAGYLRNGSRRGFLIAATVSTLAIYTNPRSIIALAAVVLALGLSVIAERASASRVAGPTSPGVRAMRSRGLSTDSLSAASRLAMLALRIAFLAGVVALLAAALLLPLSANQDLYYFAHFVEFQEWHDVWGQYRQAVPIEIIVLAGLGVVVGLLRGSFFSRTIAILLPLSYLIITVVGWSLRSESIFAQLEGPRLIPMLRPATIFLAALGAHEAFRALARLLAPDRAAVVAGGLSVGLASVGLLTSFSPLSAEQRGMPGIETTDQQAFAAINRTASFYEARSTALDKPLIIGSPISEHASFWIPALTGRDAFHGAWIWYWRDLPFADKTRLEQEAEGLELGFLRRHGLTTVLIDTQQRDLIRLASAMPHLDLLDPGSQGGYALYRVGGVDGWITFSSGHVMTVEAEPERIIVQGYADHAGYARIVVNDYPGWRARVNGQPVAVERTPDGYMRVRVPEGDVTVEMEYGTEPVVWLARSLVVIGIALLVVYVALPRKDKRCA